jgi:hypothetical protein
MTACAGPFSAVRHWTRWTVEDIRDDTKKQPIYDTREQAQQEADKRNATYLNSRTPRPPQPAQPDLFSNQEATSP